MDEKDYIEKYEDKIPYDRHWNRPQANRSDKIPDPTKKPIDSSVTIRVKNPLVFGGFIEQGISCGKPVPVIDNDCNTIIGESCTPYDLGTGDINSPCSFIVDPNDPKYDEFSDFRAQFGISLHQQH